MLVWRRALRCARGLSLMLLLLSLVNLSVCIFEDQIGKFDWRQSYIGRIKFARLDTISAARRIIVATEENVIAALNLKTGQLVWRQVLARAAAGEIQLLHVSDSAITVTGDNPYTVRGWDTARGLMLWEWSMTLNSKYPELSQWFVEQGQLYHVLPVPGSHLEISSYIVKTGANRGQTLRLSASWVNKGCILSPPRFTCISGEYGSKFIFSVDLTSTDEPVLTKPLSDYVDWATADGVMRPLRGASALPGFILDLNVLVFEGNELKVVPMELEDSDHDSSVTVIDGSNGLVVIQLYHMDGSLNIIGKSVKSGTIDREITNTQHNSVDSPVMEAALCTKERACRFLVSGGDDSMTLYTHLSSLLWSREEALANLVAVEFIDLPVSELEATIESEFENKEAAQKISSDIWGAFIRRLHSQMQQLCTTLQSLVRLAANAEQQDHEGAAVRDALDLHKLILVVSRVGKIFGVDNLTGAIVWARVVPGFSSARGVSIFVRRTARHPPHDAHVTIVASHKKTGSGLLISLNPISGSLVADGIVELDYRLKQAAILPRTDVEHLRGLVLLDQEDSVEILPLSASRLVQDFYLFVAEPETTRVQGYALKYNGREVISIKTWSVVLGGTENSGHRIVRIVPKRPFERVHSHGKVMGDRSVLYKYINPNLVLFITEGPDIVHKDVVHIFLVDAVSGAIVTSQSHKRARATPHAVHADNLLAYAYHNDKQRRMEIATVELYEGFSRSLPAGAAFSSLAEQRISPLVERQTYILPATLTAMADTVTEKGITDKHILLALSNGQIIEMPWAYLDPRRPTGALTQEHREEGLLQYAPELPLPAEAAINYNRTLKEIRAIYTASAGLESTCLVLAYGLDLYYTRVAPSKTFDLLKDDFDYYLIVLVLGALVFSTYSTKYFASRKMLRQAWK